MVEGTTPDWYLEVEGRKTGPFTTEQILGLLKEREIPETARIISTQTDSDWFTVGALAQQSAPHSLSGANPSSKPFVPPPRPAELQPSSNVPPPETQAATAKPELSLMDALRVTKERRAHSHATGSKHPESDEADEHSFTPLKALRTIPRQAWWIAATAALLVVATWSMTRFVKQKAGTPAIADAPPPAPVPAEPVAAQNPPLPPPVQPASPPAIVNLPSSLGHPDSRAHSYQDTSAED
jgi:hypothetical protein